MKKAIGIVFILGLACTVALAEKSKGKYAIVLQAGNETNEGRARAAHALLYSTELAEKGYAVVLIFDGAGTGWANEFRKPENPFYQHYLRIRALGMVEEICDYCADSYDAKESLSERQKKYLVSDYKGHPSLVKWIERGYELIVL